MKKCNIIQKYINRLFDNETADNSLVEQIKTHISECDFCKKYYNFVKHSSQNIEIDVYPQVSSVLINRIKDNLLLKNNDPVFSFIKKLLPIPVTILLLLFIIYNFYFYNNKQLVIQEFYTNNMSESENILFYSELNNNNLLNFTLSDLEN
jgi:hypothetical protein